MELVVVAVVGTGGGGDVRVAIEAMEVVAVELAMFAERSVAMTVVVFVVAKVLLFAMLVKS